MDEHVPWFFPAQAAAEILEQSAARLWDFPFAAEIRPSDPRFGDFQANGVLPAAKKHRQNPREMAAQLLRAWQEHPAIPSQWVDVTLAGPGFLNFSLSPEFLLRWMETYRDEQTIRQAAGQRYQGRRVVVDFSSPNTAKEMHVGHIRSTVIGEAVCRLLEFCGANVIRDNHLGDWGTQFGMLIWAIKKEGYDLDAAHAAPISDLEELYKKGHAAYKENAAQAEEIRQELVKLQQGDAESHRLWEKITAVSWQAFSHIYELLGIRFDCVLGESFYRDKVERIYREMVETGLAVEDQGALVVFHPEHPRFSKQPFIVRKDDGASNYATTDLATILHRVEAQQADEIVYVVDFRQGDHFEQLFLTAQKWFQQRGWKLPVLRHVCFGTVLGENGKPIKTKEGGSIKLKDLLAEAMERSLAIVRVKNESLSPGEQLAVARAVGLGAIRYVDLSQNRTSDYIFSWDKMLAFEGNTAPYLLYAVARLHSIYRKAGLRPGEGEAGASVFETPAEIALARKLVGFMTAIELTMADLRPHLLCLYLYELASHFSSFYAADMVMGVAPDVQARRLLLCARTLRTLETGLHLLGLETLERM